LLRIMTVCTGNICRSPMAEIVLRTKLENAGIGQRVVVDSTGISSEEQGNSLDPRARKVLIAAGYDDDALRTHRARQVDGPSLSERDLILPMTSLHAASLRWLASRHLLPDVEPNIVMFRTFDPASRTTRGTQDESLLDIDDPWYGGIDGFEACLSQIEAAADGIVEWARVRITGV
jgi:protein-tyrosine phosphatase